MQNTIVIGEVLKPQGVRGEIKVKPLLDDVSDVKNFRQVFIGGASYKVFSARFDAAAIYFVLSGIADRDAAELLRGKEVEVFRSELPSPEEGRYYIVDIIGCEVVSEKGERFGEIADVLPAHTDIYVLKDGEKESMFPAADGVVLDVDVENKRLIVDKKRLLQVLVQQ